MNSLIIDPVYLKNDLMWLCEFPENQNWELLYRGSETKFNWAEFHAKCDSKSPTLVIVKSKDGSIFGGYTESKWNDPNPLIQYRPDGQRKIDDPFIVYYFERKKSLSKFKSDPSAFLFILKYPFWTENDEKPVKARVVDSKYAIYCDQNDGPSFGKFDFVIQGNAQTRHHRKVNNYFLIGSSFKISQQEEQDDAVLSQPQEFDLEEIEVFQKI